jgi:pyruvate/2-oxoacid:ferredoxin oxidoreductase alpha subunit
MDKTAGKIIIDGNSAAALGCMFAGCTVVTWYPITPSSSLVETMIEYMKEYRVGPDGKATFAIVQAEDELAAIGMVIGAGWAGARSMTATAGPGISLISRITWRSRALSGTSSAWAHRPDCRLALLKATSSPLHFFPTATPNTSC